MQSNTPVILIYQVRMNQPTGMTGRTIGGGLNDKTLLHSYEFIFMKKCKNCKSKMPEELFQPFFVNGGYITDLCPICVQDQRNEIMGLPPMTEFGGEEAQSLVEEAYQYYKQ